MNRPKRILLGQLASNGDCLYATTVARQIKIDYPGCHLTWAIGSAWRSILDGNPDVDEIWEVKDYDTPGNFAQWARFEAEAKARKQRGEFDEIFLTQIAMPNFHLWTDGVRFAIYRAYPRPITVDTAPVTRLSEREVENVRQFAARHQLNEKSQVILFECAPRSQQSLVNPQFGSEVAQAIVEANPAVAVILSSNHAFDSANSNLIDGSVLTLRENAELTKYCSLLIGASSGVTWISTCDWAKPLPMIQLLVPDFVRGNSPTYDYEKRGVSTEQIIEMHDYSARDVVDCVNEIFARDFAAAKSKWGQITPLGFGVYQDLQKFLIRSLHLKQAVQLLALNLKEHGWRLPFFTLIPQVLISGILIAPSKILSRLKSARPRR